MTLVAIIACMILAWATRAYAVAWALTAMALFDAALLLRPTSAALWLLWPGASAALSWKVWRGSWWPWIAFAIYAEAVTSFAWGSPVWQFVRTAPYWASATLSLVAWATCRTRTQTVERRIAAEQRIAAAIAWSGFVDITLGALSPSGAWDLATLVAWVTWVMVAWLLVHAWLSTRKEAR